MKTLRLPDASTVFTAEAKAIDLALDFINECNSKDKFIIFSDSMLVLQTECQCNQTPDTEVQSGHIDRTIIDERPTVTILGSISSESVLQPRPSTRLDSSIDIQPFIMEKADCRAFLTDNIRLRHPASTTLRSATPRPIDMPRRLAEELSSNILRHLQDSQEEQLILRIGERDFCMSRMTLRADSESIFAAILGPDSHLRPYGRNMYFILLYL